jgi:hypothetical protein
MRPEATRHPARPRPPETADPLSRVLGRLAEHRDPGVAGWAQRLLRDGESASSDTPATGTPADRNVRVGKT